MDLYGVSSASSMFRLSGLASGLDTDKMVSDLMKAERIPLDKLTQKKQLAEWKRDDYRNITNLLRTMKDTYFDVAKPTSYALSRSYYKNFQTTSSNSAIITATAGVDAVPGTHTITVNNIATASSITGSDSITKEIEGGLVSSIDINSIKGKSITLKVDDVSRAITVGSTITTSTDLVNDLQSSIDTAFGSGKVIVTDTSGDGSGKLTFLTVDGSGVNKLSLSSGPVESSDAFSLLGFTSTSNLSNRISTGDTLETVSGKLSNSFVFNSEGKLDITINDREFLFDKSVSLASMMSAINSDSTAKVNMQYNEITDSFTFTSKQTGVGDNLEIIEQDSTFLAAAGLKSISGSNAAQYDLTNTKMNVNIDGVTKEISLSTGLADYTQLTADIKSKIEAAFSGITVDVSVDSANKLSIALQAGSGNTLSIGQPENADDSALTELGLDAGFVNGKDASVILDGESIVRSNNSFTVAGITYNALANCPTDSVTGQPVSQTVAVSLDTDSIYNNIKSFVDKYNEVITTINTKLSEEYDRNYQPLTSDQKAAMSEDEIKKWEDKAKTGLLRNDDILQNIVYGMRRALSDSVDNVSSSLSNIGITTGSFTENGILKIDETALKAAIGNNPEEVTNLFAKSSDTVYDPAMTTEQRTERYNEEGLAYRLSDILDDNIRTFNGKGILLEKAGVEGDRTEFDNTLYDEINNYSVEMSDLSRILYDKETQYYNKFTAMEEALNQMNQQSSWLMAQLGQNTSA